MDKVKPGPGQESVWDYPRPPKLEDCNEGIRVVFNGHTIADSHDAKRVLETSHPPVYYIPQKDVVMDYLQPLSETTHCEWKGRANYFDIVVKGEKAHKAAWCYPEPTQQFGSIAHYLAFYPQKMEACFVGDEKVDAQQGSFYGGWITSNIVGPFKGGPGSIGW
jgi:uncharacterized protein (DUF427 family)